MGTVHYFDGITRLDLDPDVVLEKNKGNLKGVVLIGYDHDGNFDASSTYADGGVVMWLLEQCKYELMKHGGVIE